MGYFPLFVDLEGKRCLVVGGGPVGLRKANALCEAGARVRVVSPSFCEGFAASPSPELVRRVFKPQDLEGVYLAVAATGDRSVNYEVVRLCRERNIPVDAADCPEECSFLFPATVRRGEVTLGISTGGTSPLLAGRLRAALERFLPAGLGEVAARMAALRREQKNRGAVGDPRALLQELDRAWPERPRVFLVGAGCGDPGLVTWRALELLACCDVLIYDRLVNESLLELTKDGCAKFYVGKEGGGPSASQAEITRLLLEQAAPGRIVVRLKGGDPFVFGRGGEEAEALIARGIPFEAVPGVTSATAVPACAGIPVTHRGLSRSFHVFTGHSAREGERLDYPLLARLEGSLVFLMGLGAAEEICSGLISAGKAPDTPAAAIASGSLPQQRVVRADLAGLPEAIREGGLTPPVVLVVGAAAALHLNPFYAEENRSI